MQQKLSDKPWARWTALLIVSVTMMFGYFFTDIMAPLDSLLTSQSTQIYFENGKALGADLVLQQNTDQFQRVDQITVGSQVKIEEGDKVVSHTVSSVVEGKGWSNSDYGFFSGSYSFINIFLLMLFLGGIILDKMGVRFTGILSCALMFAGAIIKWYALSTDFGTATIFGYTYQVALACLGFAIYGVGCEITGITISKVITKWFYGHELALAMGLQVALARIGTALTLSLSLPIAKHFGDISYSVLFGAIALLVGLLIYLVYCFMDKKEDASIATSATTEAEDAFSIKDLHLIFSNKGFWLIAFLCLLFYSGVFPFIKFAVKLMEYKYHVAPDMAGKIVALFPFGTIFMTPLFGRMYDKIGKGVTLMIIGSTMLTLVHVLFALPFLNVWWFAIFIIILLGIAFSLVPSAMWPSVPKIIPMKQLGTAYATIFYIQNIGLMLVPMFIGWVIENYAAQKDASGAIMGYDYTIPMCIFAVFGLAAVLVSIALRHQDKVNHYGLEARPQKTKQSK